MTMGHIRQLFPLKQVVRIGWINGESSNRLLSDKSIRIKRRPSMHLNIQQKKKGYKTIGRRLPDWIEARSIVKASGSIIPPLIISDNNIGLVTIDRSLNRITQTFLVRKEMKKEVITKIHRSIIEMKHAWRHLCRIGSVIARKRIPKHNVVYHIWSSTLFINYSVCIAVKVCSAEICRTIKELWCLKFDEIVSSIEMGSNESIALAAWSF